MTDWTRRVRNSITALARRQPGHDATTMEQLCDLLLSAASSSAKQSAATEIHARFANGDTETKRDFLRLLATRYTADFDRLDKAIADYLADRSAQSLAELHAWSEPRRQQVLRLLNEVPGGTHRLLQMRSDALRIGRDLPGFAALDADFAHLFRSWFNTGFLSLRRLDWSTPGVVLSKLIVYEAVHEIGSWEELRARMEPRDRRLYAFFHPAMADEPLIFVEVALTTNIPERIIDLLRIERATIDPDAATTAAFYSISNCQDGLRGIPFGGPLIKQVMESLRRELPSLRRAVTLSPMPGFAKWLELQAENGAAERALLSDLAEPGWPEDEVRAAALREPLMRLAARYILTAQGRAADPVARFHLGNGACAEQLDWLGDPSLKGLRQSFGMMINYLYDPARIDSNSAAFAANGEITASHALRRLSRDERGGRLPWLAAR